MISAAGSGLLQDDRRDGGEIECRRTCSSSVRARACSCWRAATAATGACAGPIARAGPSIKPCSTPSRGDLRRGGERVARLGDLAQRRPRRDMGALERGDRLPRRGRRLEAVEGLVRDAGARPAARRRGVGRACSRAPTAARPSRSLTTFEGQEGREAWNDPAQQPPGHLGLSAIIPHPEERRPLLDHRPGLQPVRDDRRRQDVDAPQQGPPQRLARRLRGDRLLRPQGGARRRLRADVPAEPRRHAPLRRRRPDVDGDHRGPADASSASPPRRTRTTATPST